MKSIIFATQNKNKLDEICSLLQNLWEIKSLNDLNFHEEIDETGITLEENALIKAHFVFNKYKMNCFADDTGLEVEALNGEPGVYSARYAGSEKSPEKNMNKLLDALKNKENRSAQFKTVIALIIDGKEFLFEGIMKGKITKERKGNNGFGYDPIFIPDGFDKTFAEMQEEEKNEISHRGQAVKKLISFLQQL